jgi:hypothetical protein
MGGLFYQSEANHIVDYDLWQLDGCDEMFRGPQMVLSPKKYVSFIGAAQTFGTFCRYPFPTLISERISLATANLGIGGAGPERFSSDPALMNTINRSKVAVVQVMSGRSAPNKLYENLQGTSSLRPRDNPSAPWVWAEGVWDNLFKEKSQDEFVELMEDTRQNWVRLMKELLLSIQVPKILLWISIRDPDCPVDLSSAEKALGLFPHLVNKAMLEEIMSLADRFVDAKSSRGIPQPLYNRFSGGLTSLSRPDYVQVKYNNHYPSPEMHVDITEKLTPVLRELIR